jgi:LacI family transcriptional regulator
MVTAIDVARRAGVSKSTVSNVIRGATLVAETTQQRVERAIAKAGYHPNAVTLSRRVPRSGVRTLGWVAE